MGITNNAATGTGYTPLKPCVLGVTVNGTPLSAYNMPPLLDGQLHMGYNQHDHFYLRFEFSPSWSGNLSNLSIWPNATPIKIQWGRSPDIHHWYGYVTAHEFHSNADSGTATPQLTYVCVGTSTVMDTAQSRKWENVSPTYIASQIAFENNLRAVTTPSSTVLTYEAQVGESDHQFLGRIAAKTGFRYFVTGGTLYMVDPAVSLQGAGVTATPKYTMNKILGQLDTCRNFRLSHSITTPGQVQATRAIYGIDASSGVPFAANVPTQQDTTRVAINTAYASTNVADAQMRTNAWASLSQYWVTATAQVYGDTSIYPGKLILIEGQATPSNAAGFWLVNDVKHSVVMSYLNASLDSFLSNVTLIRNTSTGVAPNLIGTKPITPEFSRMVLNSTTKQWTSTNLGTVSLV